MTPEQRAKLETMLSQLTPEDRRVIQYEAKGGHSCTASTHLITCCGTERCQACHIPHLKENHDPATLHAYQKFVNARSLTWQGQAYKLPLPAKKNKVNRKPTIVKRAIDPKSFADSVSDNNLEQVFALIAAKLGKS